MSLDTDITNPNPEKDYEPSQKKECKHLNVVLGEHTFCKDCKKDITEKCDGNCEHHWHIQLPKKECCERCRMKVFYGDEILDKKPSPNLGMVKKPDGECMCEIKYNKPGFAHASNCPAFLDDRKVEPSWKERFREKFMVRPESHIPTMKEEITIFDLEQFIEKVVEEAREEGIKEGMKSNYEECEKYIISSERIIMENARGEIQEAREEVGFENIKLIQDTLKAELITKILEFTAEELEIARTEKTTRTPASFANSRITSLSNRILLELENELENYDKK